MFNYIHKTNDTADDPAVNLAAYGSSALGSSRTRLRHALRIGADAQDGLREAAGRPESPAVPC